MTREYKIYAGQLAQPSEEITSLLSLDFVNALNELPDTQDPATLFEAFSHLSALDIAYLYALAYGEFDHRAQARLNQRQKISGLLATVQDPRVESFITELIQNAQDVSNDDEVLKIAFEFTDKKELNFSHNGPHFTPKQLEAACTVGRTTKSLNLHTIGRFGLGLKYWRQFFSRIQISSRNQKIQHSLVEEHHKPGDTFVPFIQRAVLEQDAGQTTKFTFSKPSEKFSDQFDSIHSLFSKRLSKSLSLLTQPRERGILIAFKQHQEDQLSKFNLKAFPKCEIDTDSDIILEIVECKIGEEKHSVLKSSRPVSWFEQALPEQFKALKEALAADYVETMLRRGEQINNDEAEKIIAGSLESTNPPLYLSVIYDPTLESQGGYLASKFIGLETNFDSAPFLIDAPFRLHQNRHQLNMGDIDQGKAINTPLIAMICSLLQATLPHTISGPVREELGLNVQHYDELLNGSFNMETSSEFTKLFEKNTQLFSILKSTPDCGVVKGDCAAPASLMHYWRTMIKRGIDEKWFWGALNPSIARIEIQNGDAGPIQVLLGENIVLDKLGMREPWFDGIYGDGIPDEIVDLYSELNEVQLNESPHLGTTITPFDGGVTFFASEKAHRFVKKFEFEADTITPIVDAFHGALGQALRASSSEYELYCVVHEHRAGTKTTWKPTKDLELISHLFELSLNQEDEDVLSEHNICNQLETRFKEAVQSGNAPKTYTLLKDSENNLALVKLPQTNYVACVLLGDDQYEMCSIKYTSTGLNPKQMSFIEPPLVKVWASEDVVTWFTFDGGIHVPKPALGNVTEQWERISIHTNPNTNCDWNWVRLNQIVEGAPANVDRIVIVDLLMHDPDVETALAHNLGIYADTKKRHSSGHNDEKKPQTRKYPSTRRITPPVSDVHDVLLAKVLYQAQEFPEKAKAKFPSGDLSISFYQTNFSCSGDEAENFLTMSEGTGHVSTGMSVKVDQGDTTYCVTQVDAERIILSSNLRKSVEDEKVYFNAGMTKRKHAILRFNDLATYLSLEIGEVNDAELHSYLSAYDNIRWLKGRSGLSTYAYDCYWRNRIPSGTDLQPRCTKIHAQPSAIGVITAQPDGVEEIPRIFENIHGFTRNYPLDVHMHIPQNLMVRKFAGDALPVPFVIKPEDEVSAPLVEGLRGFVVQDAYSAAFEGFAGDRNVLELMVRGVLEMDDDASPECLQWLNNLVENYDIISWFGQSGTFTWEENNRYPSSHLKDCLMGRESFDEGEFKEEYPKLHSIVFSERNILWSSVLESVELNSTSEEIKSEYPNAILPMVSIRDGVLSYQEDAGPKASELSHNHIVFIEHFDLSLLDLLNIQEGMQAVLLSQGQTPRFSKSKLLPILNDCGWIAAHPPQSVCDTLIRVSGSDGTKVEDTDLPLPYRWLLPMRREMNNIVELNILNGGNDQPTAKVHYSKNCISMFVHDGEHEKLVVDVYLPTEPSTTLSYEQWEAIYRLFMKTIKKHAETKDTELPMDIEEITNSLTILGPWSSSRDDCIEEFGLATNQLDDSTYTRFACASEGDVEQFLNEVARIYLHEEKSVKDTKKSLRQQKDRYYGNLHGVLSQKWSTNSQLHQLRSIWYWALPNEDKKRMQKAELPEDSIGEYMLLNLEEDGWFSAKQDQGLNRCKFVEDYASMMKTALIEQCSADASVQHVEIPDLVFEEKSGKTLTMVFNKVHLFFIIGGLRAGGVPDA